MLLSGDNLRI